MASKPGNGVGTERTVRDQAPAHPEDKPGSSRGYIPFQVADWDCWAVRANHDEPVGEDAHELGTREVSGWLWFGDQTYVVMVERKAGERVEAAEEVWETLSERETQIAVLVSRGKGTKQIAGSLHISEHTVRSYMRRIFSKLHVSNRPAMVAQLIKLSIGRGEPSPAKTMKDQTGSAKSLQEFQAAHESVFKAMDANEDGVVTLDEMRAFMQGGSAPKP
jgi:DNA-binding CsgD family transcriptional regulator